MRYFYIGLAVLVLLVLLFILFCCLRKKWAEKRVCLLGREIKQRRLEEALSVFGFCYCARDDSISSVMHPWQREMGYCRAYDEAAPSMNMVFECEPVYFDYNGRHYLIEFWKGQYGCTTGAEIGVYVHNGGADGHPESLFYESVGDEERLPMRFALYKRDRIIFERSGVHWWLTGFEVGMFSAAKELRMEIGICFPNRKMCMAFCEGMVRMGCAPEKIRVEQTWVYFTFDRPWSSQPAFYSARYLRRINRKNRRNCRRYCRITKCFCSTLDKICYIAYCFPCLFRSIRRIGTRCTPARLKAVRKRTGLR